MSFRLPTIFYLGLSIILFALGSPITKWLVVHGDHDFLPLAGAREWVTTLPNAQLRIVSQAEHFPWAESPEAVFSAIELFFTGRGSEQ